MVELLCNRGANVNELCSVSVLGRIANAESKGLFHDNMDVCRESLPLLDLQSSFDNITLWIIYWTTHNLTAVMLGLVRQCTCIYSEGQPFSVYLVDFVPLFT